MGLLLRCHFHTVPGEDEEGCRREQGPGREAHEPSSVAWVLNRATFILILSPGELKVTWHPESDVRYILPAWSAHLENIIQEGWAGMDIGAGRGSCRNWGQGKARPDKIGRDARKS